MVYEVDAFDYHITSPMVATQTWIIKMWNQNKSTFVINQIKHII